MMLLATQGSATGAVVVSTISASAVVVVGLLSWVGQKKQVQVTGNVSATDVAIDGLDRLVNNLQEELSTKRDELNIALSRCVVCEQQMKDLQVELGHKDAELDDLQTRLLAAQEEIRQLRKQRNKEQG